MERLYYRLDEYLLKPFLPQELLWNTSLKIQDIAEACGYDDQRYFASSFKKQYGCTPTGFKEIAEKEGMFFF